MSFEPKILGILCNWCSYSGADAAGSSKLSYPPNLHVVRVMCSGRVEPSLVLRALAGNADGVLIAGCHPGDCHYVNGNYRAIGRFRLLQRMLIGMGLEPERLRLEFISATEGERYAKIVNEMTEQIRAIGPLQWPAPEILGEDAAIDEH